MKKMFKVLSIAALVGCSLLAEDRAPREDTPSATANDAVVSPIIDTGIINADLANIKGTLGNVSQGVAEDTVLAVLGDANSILGTSISQGIEDLSTSATQGDGIPITGPGTLSDSGLYFVANDITGNILIDADDVTIEGRGRTITGLVSVSGDSRICIHDLRVNNVGAHCVSFATCNDICLKHVFVTGGTDGFAFVSCTSIKMEDCLSNACTANACELDNCKDVVILHSRFLNATGAASDGIDCSSTQNLFIDQCDFASNGRYGMFLNNTDTGVISNSTFMGNGLEATSAGLRLNSTSSYVMVKNCEVTNNNARGLWNDTDQQNLFFNNFAANNPTADFDGVVNSTTVHYQNLGFAGTFDNIYTGIVL